jgi:hypothetical protein
MIDEIFDRSYQARRAEMNHALSAGFLAVGRALRNAFEVLNRIEYDAPWVRKSRTSRVH